MLFRADGVLLMRFGLGPARRQSVLGSEVGDRLVLRIEPYAIRPEA